jgi:RNA polymerase sigma-70 factor (ECF subfamily)
MDDLSDEQLVARYRAEQGTPSGAARLDELFRRHRPRVSTWCYRMTGDVDSAADLAQDVLLKAFQRLESFRGESRFTTWLYSITRNQCMDALRARPVKQEQYTDELAENLASFQQEDASMALERKESEQMVQELVREALDETESKVMTMHYVEELPLDAITRLLGLTNPSGAKAYIVNGRRKLSRAFERRRKQGGTEGVRRA